MRLRISGPIDWQQDSVFSPAILLFSFIHKLIFWIAHCPAPHCPKIIFSKVFCQLVVSYTISSTFNEYLFLRSGSMFCNFAVLKTDFDLLICANSGDPGLFHIFLGSWFFVCFLLLFLYELKDWILCLSIQYICCHGFCTILLLCLVPRGALVCILGGGGGLSFLIKVAVKDKQS